MAEVFLGVVADDFTGASDAASMLSGAGIPTVLLNGVPDRVPELREDILAIVIAEKTRTIPRNRAVEEMLRAFSWLHTLGAKQLYFKYCATFDSTKEGNIGPVADAVLEKYELPYTVLAPALPVNGRTVKEGILYVNGVPLAESHMRNHPLTPMTDSELTKLMEQQSGYHAYRISVEEMKKQSGKGAEPSFLREEDREGREKYYLVPDYYEEAHGDLIADCFSDLLFLTGGSGLCGALGRRYVRQHPKPYTGTAYTNSGNLESSKGKTLLLAGSCSKITLEQIVEYQSKGGTSHFIDPVKLMEGKLTLEELEKFISENEGEVLLYSSQKPEEILKTQKLGQESVAETLEKTMGALAAYAVRKGYTRIISAGGETSGAVTKALGYRSFYIGKSVAPGVPMMIPVENPELRLVLKSGGFGQKDFFKRAIELMA